MSRSANFDGGRGGKGTGPTPVGLFKVEQSKLWTAPSAEDKILSNAAVLYTEIPEDRIAEIKRSMARKMWHNPVAGFTGYLRSLPHLEAFAIQEPVTNLS